MLRTCRAVAGRERKEPWRSVFGLGDSAALASFLRLPHGLWLLQCARPHFLCPGLWGGRSSHPERKHVAAGHCFCPQTLSSSFTGNPASGGLHLSLHHQLCCTPSGPWRWPFLLGAPPLPSDWTEGACLIPCQCRVFGTALHKLEGSLRVPPLRRWPAIHRTLSLACSSCQMSRLCC